MVSKSVTKIVYLMIIIMAIVFISSCSKDADKIDDKPDAIMTELGEYLPDLRSDMMGFILKTYMPSKNDTKDDYVSDIIKYLSNEEYQSLLSDIGEYSDAIKTEVNNIQIKYGLAENNMDNCDKVLCSFDLYRSANGVKVKNHINIVFNIQGGKIVHHTVYTGDTMSA